MKVEAQAPPQNLDAMRKQLATLPMREQLETLQSMIQNLTNEISTVQEKVETRRRSRTTTRVDSPTTTVAAPEPPKPPPTLRERIETALVRESLDADKLARALNESTSKVETELQKLENEGKVYNVGWVDSPIWTWRVGNDVDAATLTRVIRRLISERPMYTKDLLRATGAALSRVSGALVEIQRADRVLDMSAGGRAKQYFLVGERVREAKVAPKTRDGKPVNHGRRRKDQP